MASKEAAVPTGPKPKFTVLGKSKFVHVVRTKAWDLKHSTCQQVRKYTVAEKINYKASLSPEAALALDTCEHCATKVVAEALIPDDVKKAAKRDKRDDVMKRAKESTQTKAQAKKAAKVKAEPKAKTSKPAKATKSGPRSTGGDDQSKAGMLADFAKEHGWDAAVNAADPGLVVTAVRGAETVRCYFIDGKYDTSRHASVTVGDWTGKLRGVHGCRKQMSGEGRDRPHPEPGKGRSGPRRKSSDDDADSDEAVAAESPEDAKRRVPFLLDEDEAAIIDAIKGRTLRWRNGVSKVIEEATVPTRPDGKKRSLISITEHPKTGRRMVNFLTVVGMTEHGEQFGPERTVYLDKIVRVIG